jgi:ABC-type dipeptide/oligopeptide/nickel transport system permease subunit
VSTDVEREAQPEIAQRTGLETFVKNLRQNRLSVVGAVIIVTIVLVAILAPVLAPHDPLRQFNAPDGQFNPVPPGTQVGVTNDNGQVVGTTTVWLGTDSVGRDILSRMIFGLRTLFLVSLSVLVISLVAGVAVGGIAGYYKDTWIDELFMRIMDLVFSFPAVILAVGLIGVFGTGGTTIGPVTIPSLIKVIFVVAIAYTPRFARVMRGATLKEMEEDYVDAVRALGARDYRILVGDVLVNTIPVIVVQASLYMGAVVLITAALSFLGLGIQPPTPSLGLMLSASRSHLYSGAWWYSVFPGLAIIVIVLGFNLLGDGLRDALDPRYSEEGLE